jgi:hypothetical protein
VLGKAKLLVMVLGEASISRSWQEMEKDESGSGQIIIHWLTIHND